MNLSHPERRADLLWKVSAVSLVGLLFTAPFIIKAGLRINEQQMSDFSDFTRRIAYTPQEVLTTIPQNSQHFLARFTPGGLQ